MLLQWVDIAILSVIALSVLTGLFRGFVKELISLCIWISAFWLGYHYAESLDPFLKSYLHDKTIRTAVAFIVILFATLLVGGIINSFLSFILKRAGLGGTDRTLGMCFGFLRGIFIVGLLMVAAKITSLPYEVYAQSSLLYARFDPVTSLLYAHLPEFIQQVKTLEPGESKIDTALMKPPALKGAS